MIKTPYHFEADLSDQDFQKLGQFACRWAHIEHTIGNCLRVMREMEPATVMVFPLSLDLRMTRISKLAKQRFLTGYQLALLAELKPLIKAMQYLRNTTLHGVVMSFEDDPDKTHFNLRSKDRNLNLRELFSCVDLINYTAHVTQAFRLSLGDKTYEGHQGHTYVLPHRPHIPEFLPKDCRKFPKDDTGLLREEK
jgi:hypothetical protein